MKNKKVLVCGGRDFADKEFLFAVLDVFSPSVVVHGNASGADTLSKEWAENNEKTHIPHSANWKKFGKQAGYLRNKEMLDEHPDIDFVIAFDGGRGTKMMRELAKKRGIKVYKMVKNKGEK